MVEINVMTTSCLTITLYYRHNLSELSLVIRKTKQIAISCMLRVNSDQQMDQRMDRWTNGPMDRRTYPLIEMRRRI